MNAPTPHFDSQALHGAVSSALLRPDLPAAPLPAQPQSRLALSWQIGRAHV